MDLICLLTKEKITEKDCMDCNKLYDCDNNYCNLMDCNICLNKKNGICKGE